MKTLRKVIAAGYIFILMLFGGILFTFIYEWKQTENHKKEVQKIRMFCWNIHDAYALKVDMSLHAENILNWKDIDTVLYNSKRLVIDSLLAEFNQYYTEDGIDEIRQMLVEKERQLLEVWEIMKRHETLNEQMTQQIPVIVRDEEIQSKREKGVFGLFQKK